MIEIRTEDGRFVRVSAADAHASGRSIRITRSTRPLLTDMVPPPGAMRSPLVM